MSIGRFSQSARPERPLPVPSLTSPWCVPPDRYGAVAYS